MNDVIEHFMNPFTTLRRGCSRYDQTMFNHVRGQFNNIVGDYVGTIVQKCPGLGRMIQGDAAPGA